MTQITVLRMFAKVWTAFSIALIAIGALGILLKDGFVRLAEIFSPFNVFNTVAIVLLISPAVIASRRAKHLENAIPLSDEEAQRLVNEYGGVLMQRSGLERLPVAALPAPKPRMKDAIKYAASRAARSSERDQLGVGYVLLADFQPNDVPQNVQLLEMAALTAEWQAFARSATRPLIDQPVRG